MTTGTATKNTQQAAIVSAPFLAKRFAARANAVMLIPQVYVTQDLQYRVQCHPVLNNDYERHFYLCYRRGMYLTRYMTDFIRLVCEKLGVPFHLGE